ncbi:RDD family protein [Granulicella paludicola]|uniref:RDD family protein n=1 Tax=Granulicella paludicola TaxID=474951 RepID=UPI0021E04AD0|nr:RDD family protein [Granulicella paludicola]
MLKLEKLTGKREFRAHETHRMDELNGLPLASFKRRGIAIAIDFAIIAALKLIFGMHGHKEEIEVPKGSFAWMLMEAKETVLELVESTFYFAVALKFGKGQTPGKWLMKIKVLSLTHHEIGWWQSIERGLGYGASILEGGFGFLQYYINRNRMTVHDRIAETIVVDVVADADAVSVDDERDEL